MPFKNIIMPFKNIIICVVFISTYFCDADILTDYPEKCSIKDGECQNNTLTSLLRGGAEIGFPELGIPPLDPYIVKDTTVTVLGIVDITMTEGQVEGATNCSFTKFETNFDARYTYTESFCDHIKISGHYKIEVGPLTQALIGEPVSGDGHGKIEIEKMILKSKMPFSIQKFDDNKIYLVPEINKAEYSTNDIENISFGATSVKLGGREISEQLIGFMNSNWGQILRSFGRLFSDKLMATFYRFLKEFFATIPASELVSDDLSAHVQS